MCVHLCVVHYSEDKQTIFLIGILCGLAIYNQTIIPLPFPLAMYKKLLKEPVNFHDLEILSPQLAKYVFSLNNVLISIPLL